MSVKDAWSGPGDQISVVYTPPYMTIVIGLRRTRTTPALWEYGDFSGPEFPYTSTQFGENVASRDMGEPLGNTTFLFVDSAGIQWWGDFEFPEM